MSYSEALEQQLRYLDTLNSVGLRNMLLGTEMLRGNASRAQDSISYGLSVGETFFWSKRITEALDAAVQTIPLNWSPCAESWPAQSAFFWFEDPVKLPLLFGSIPKEPPVEAPMTAISYSYRGKGQSAFIVVWTRPITTPPIPPWPSLVFEWSDGKSIETITNDLIQGDENPARAPFKVKYLACALAFIRDSILTTSARQAERPVRRRLLRMGIDEVPAIRVVELRRRHVSAQRDDDSECVDWSCQWVVSGHWRQQWYPSLNAYQPKWIMPYVKGPEDKPLRPPRAKVFAVVR